MRNLQLATLFDNGTDMNVTVFGAAGQIGRLVVRDLLAVFLSG
jgi:hypothetical protein